MKRNFKRSYVNNSGSGASDSLQDLDRELELLRRKRQLLENQQQQYQPEYSRPSPWDQPPRSNEYSGSGRSFTQSQYADHYDSSRRQTQATSWQEPEAKRYRQQEFDSRPAPRSFQGQRSQQYAPPKSYKPPAKYPLSAPNRPKGFVNPKPTFANPRSTFANPKPTYANNKPGAPKPRTGPVNAKTVSSTHKSSSAYQKSGSVQKPAPKANKSAATAPSVDKEGPNSGYKFLNYVLTEDDDRYPPTVRGRLEVVLGDLFRGFKDRLDAELPTELYRFVKQVYRQRIRNTMLGKPLGTTNNIATLYAENYPAEDDADVLRIAKEAQAKDEADKCLLDASEMDLNPYLKNIVATADSPEAYFIQNWETVASNKMDEILARIKKICEEESVSVTELVQEVDKISKKEEKSEGTANGDVATEEKAAEDGETASGGATDAPATDSSEPKVEEASAAADSGEAKAESEPTTRKEYYSKLMNALIMRELPKVLPSYKDFLAGILSSDMTFARAQKYITQVSVTVARSRKRPECFVMILGEPKMPRKEELQVFLNKFNPASIKRHKRVRNVLYVGFSDRQDFDRIIAEDGVDIAEMKIHIKESKNYRENPFKIQNGMAKLVAPKVEGDATVTKETEKSTDKETGNDTAEQTAEETILDTTVESANETAEDDKSLLDSDIDGQINDLLTSVNDDEAVDAAEATDDVAAEDNDVTGGADMAESNDVTEAETVEGAEETANGEKMDTESSEVPKTTTRASTRLAGGIQTRRASRLAQ